MNPPNSRLTSFTSDSSKNEYLEMQGKMFDMASKKGMMTMDQFKSFMMEFRTFGQ